MIGDNRIYQKCMQNFIFLSIHTCDGEINDGEIYDSEI